MTKYFVTGGSGLWNSSSSWALTSGGVGGSGIPTATDDVIFDINSPACTISTTVGVCLSFNATTYTNTITFTVGLIISGNITLGASMNFAGAGTLTVNASSTMTSNGKTLGVPLTLNNLTPISNIYTLVDNWTINAVFTTTANANGLTHTINGNNIFCLKGFTINTGSSSSSSLTTGSTVIQITGPGNIITSSNTTGGLGNNFIINAPGSNIVISGNLYYKTGTFKYIAGTITTSASSLTITGSCSLDMNNGGLNYQTPFSLATTTNSTITMLSDFYVNSINLSGGPIINGFTIYNQGGMNAQTGNSSGTTILVFKGTGTITGSGNISFPLVFDSGANTITLAQVTMTSGSITYTSGIINATNLVQISNGMKLSTAGMTFNNLSILGSSATYTLNGLLSVNGILLFSNSNYTFNGTSGFTANTLTYTSTPATTNTGIILTSGLTYTVTNALNLFPVAISTTTQIYLGIKSTTPGSQANFILSPAATQSVGMVQTTDINSSGGQTIWDWRAGTISNSHNWNVLTTPKTVAHTWTN